ARSTGVAPGRPIRSSHDRLCKESFTTASQSSERLIGVLSSEIDKSLSQWTDRHRNDLASQLGLFASILNCFRVFDYCRLIRAPFRLFHMLGQSFKSPNWKKAANCRGELN